MIINRSIEFHVVIVVSLTSGELRVEASEPVDPLGVGGPKPLEQLRSPLAVDGKGRRMRYDRSDDQLLLAETTRKFLEARSPISEVRRLADDAVGFDRGIWREGAELGWVSLFVPEAFGGMAESASGAVDAAIVAEELGRVVFAGPFLPAN